MKFSKFALAGCLVVAYTLSALAQDAIQPYGKDLTPEANQMMMGGMQKMLACMESVQTKNKQSMQVMQGVYNKQVELCNSGRYEEAKAIAVQYSQDPAIKKFVNETKACLDAMDKQMQNVPLYQQMKASSDQSDPERYKNMDAQKMCAMMTNQKK